MLYAVMIVVEIRVLSDIAVTMTQDILSPVMSCDGRNVRGEETSEKNPVSELEGSKVKRSSGASQTYTIFIPPYHFCHV